jgi:hypothetical protein
LDRAAIALSIANTPAFVKKLTAGGGAERRARGYRLHQTDDAKITPKTLSRRTADIRQVCFTRLDML